AIPFVGPLIAEIAGAIIPNQRIDRIESLLQFLYSKIPEEDRQKVKQRITSKESVDLIEDGFIQASRALSEERKEYIASLLKNSLTDDDLKYIEYKRLLYLLGELNDLEILILKSQTMLYGLPEHEDFWAAHEGTLTPPPAHIGSTQEEIDKHTIFQTHKLHLANLGLLKIKFKKYKKGETPEFDEKTGMIKAQGYEITSLGKLLLRSIDQGGEI
ncbi:MAG: hypothetical protein EOM12_11140, partial [Verrucomicrobiae bacterium]|nr:hypothetical protein [Verrucomicrobiae bacterium]